MTLREYLSETYDIMGEKEKKKKSLRKWEEAQKEYDDKIAKVSDEEWKEAKKQLAHNVLNSRFFRGKLVGPEKINPEVLRARKAELKARKREISDAYENMKDIFDVLKIKKSHAPMTMQAKMKMFEQELKIIEHELDQIDKAEKSLSESKPRLSGKPKVFLPGSNKPKRTITTKQKMIDKIIADANFDRRTAKWLNDLKEE